MAGPPTPPFGIPWHPNIGNNPNIARHHPPPPVPSHEPHAHGHIIIAQRPPPPPAYAELPPDGHWILGPAPTPASDPVTTSFSIFARPAPPPPPPSPAIVAAGPFAPGGYIWTSPAPAPGVPPPTVAPSLPNCGMHFGPVPPAQTDPSILRGGRPPGVTILHAGNPVIIKLAKNDLAPFYGQHISFEVEHVQTFEDASLQSTIVSLKRLCVGHSGTSEAEEMNGWAVTEIVELGDGNWQQGSTFAYGSNEAQSMKIKDVGWTRNRNREGHAALWVWAHRV